MPAIRMANHALFYIPTFRGLSLLPYRIIPSQDLHTPKNRVHTSRNLHLTFAFFMHYL